MKTKRIAEILSMQKRAILIVPLLLMLAGCATNRSLTSKHYLPDWENQLIYLPNASESSGGQWAVKGGKAVASGVEHTVRVPLALAGNAAVNAYYIPTWPFRWAFRGDKRLIVWRPILSVGESAGSKYFSSEWNQDLV
jgi:hypothetical protein